LKIDLIRSNMCQELISRAKKWIPNEIVPTALHALYRGVAQL
jgi:hypothetical protein